MSEGHQVVEEGGVCLEGGLPGAPRLTPGGRGESSQVVEGGGDCQGRCGSLLEG